MTFFLQILQKLISFLLIVMAGGVGGYPFPSAYDTSGLNRSSFPAGFAFATSSSAYQYEGAVNIDGRGPSIWDTFTHKCPGEIADGSNGDVALDSYHKYKEDVAIMKEMGLDAYRFSISWSRILPKGKASAGVNKKGVQYYNNLINELLANGIEPYVTTFHFDAPQALEDDYGGFLSPRIVSDFKEYVDVCFREFGDRVKHWITVNEPGMFCYNGYVSGAQAPGRWCSKCPKLNCSGGDSATDQPYLVAHHLLLAHAVAVQLYRNHYQARQKGKIGITLQSKWYVPYSNVTQNRDAALRSLDFELGWFLEPLVHGDYPHSMRTLVGNRLQKFTEEESAMLKGSFDFLGLNYYTANYAHNAPKSNNEKPSYATDSQVTLTPERNGKLIGPQTGSSWLFVYPKGILKLLLYVKHKYGNPMIYITENGVSELNNSTLPIALQLSDTMRIDYHYRHLKFLRRALKKGVKVRGYFAWSLLDNFEWMSGFTVRFGINYVDYNNGLLKRYPKYSAIWFKSFLIK